MTSNSSLKEIAFDAYQYFYPLVIMDITRRQATNVTDATSVPMRAPINQFAHFREFPAGDSRDVVRFNFDTLYSFAWLDLSAEPMVVTVPHSPDRYYLTPMLDMWSDVFAVPGTRTTDGVGGNFAVTGPGWTGDIPEGVEVLTSPTAMVWVMGRTQANGRADFPKVHAIQNQYRVTPLSAWGTDYAPPAGVVDSSVDDVTDPMALVNSMSGVELFAYAAELLRIHPPHQHDYPILARMRKIGIVPGEPFDTDSLDPETEATLNQGSAEALQDMIGSTTDGSLGTWSGEWMTIEGGTYGTNYRRRAMVALAGLGCNLTEDALYPGTATDADGERLSGEHRYILHFDSDQLPKANAFWSLTMYDDEGFQVPNPIDRYALGDRDPLQYGEDGSLDLYIQRESPGPDRESNWLPAPEGTFQPMLRIYSPAQELLRYGVRLPSLRKTE